MTKFKQIAKRTALVVVKFVEVFVRVYMYVFHPMLGALLALGLSSFTKRTYYEWFDILVGDALDIVEELSEMINDKLEE